MHGAVLTRGTVPTPGCDCVAIRAKGNTIDSAGVSPQRVSVGGGCHIPQTHGAVPTPGGCDCVAIRTKGDTNDAAGVSLQRAFEGSGCYIP